MGAGLKHAACVVIGDPHQQIIGRRLELVAAPATLSISGYLLFEDGCGANEYQVEGATLDHAGLMQLAAPPRSDNAEGEDC